MIAMAHEELLSLAEAAKDSRLPRRRAGKRPHVSTLYRWSKHGCNGVRLETIRFGGTLCTSIEAIQRFAEQLTAADRQDLTETLGERADQVSGAESQLTDLGF